MKKASLILCTVAIIALMFSSCGGSSSKEVTIGNQVWMTENLNAAKFRNGDPIPQVKTEEEWEKADKEGKPAWSYFDNDPDNGEKYGKLYNWYAVNDPRGLAPEGWHIPSDKEWKTMEMALGMSQSSVDGTNRHGTDGGKKMKSTSDWNDNGNGTNSSCFNGHPGGRRNGSGSFSELGKNGFWWTSSESSSTSAWCRILYYRDDIVYRADYFRSVGLNVRCVKDQ